MAGFEDVIAECRAVFVSKYDQYGPSWLFFRPISLVDQIFIKAHRIRTLQGLEGEQRVRDRPVDEFVGIVNYALLAIDAFGRAKADGYDPFRHGIPPEWRGPERAAARYDEVVGEIRTLHRDKDHDYGSAWRKMEMEGLTDEVLVRTARLKELLRDETTASEEDVEAQFRDIVNYAAFALARLAEEGNG